MSSDSKAAPDPRPEGDDARNRRSFLGLALGATSLAAPALILASGTPAEAQDDEVGSRAIRPGRGALPSLYPNWLRKNFREIQADENAHVETIVSALGAAARPKPTFRNLRARNVRQFAIVSQALENTGVGAYLAATPFISSKDYLAAAASIALVEAYHSGFLNTLANDPIVPGGSAFAKPLTVQEVVNAAGPFVASLNGGPDLNFGTTPSPENDIAILNFALALEYLEAEFYNVNVPRFFR